MSNKNSGRAVIQGKSIVIRLPIANLSAAVEGGWAAGVLDPRMKITDPAEFAKELVYVLNGEEEDGTTRVHRMFDGAIQEAFEQGAMGCEEHPIQEV